MGAAGSALRRAREQRAVVVDLDHPNRAVGRRVEAQPAEHALVEVLLDQAQRPVVLLAVDVDRADLGELLRHLGVGGDDVVDLDGDEQGVGPHAAAVRSASLAFTRPGISEISSATVIPASARRAIFSVAVSSLPSTIVPAWPNDIPGISSMNRPAMKATIGILESCSRTHPASGASIRP